MSNFLRIYLAVTGIGAGLAILFPGLVVVGFYLLIVPGLILSLMPAAFLWGLTFAVIWTPLQHFIGPWLASVIALPSTFAIFWILATPGHQQSVARLAGIVRPDVSPGEPIVLRGHVRVDMMWTKLRRLDGSGPARSQGKVQGKVCNDLCAALLFTPGVESVTLNGFERTDKPYGYVFGDEPLQPSARTFRLVPRAECGPDPETPDFSEADKSIAAEWLIDLSTNRCLVSEPAIARHDLHLTIGEYWVHGEHGRERPWSLDAWPVRVDRLELRDAGGRPLLHRMVAETKALARPLMPWGAGRGGGDLSTFRFGWARGSLSNKPRGAGIKAKELLGTHTNLRLANDPAVAFEHARDRLIAMVADPRVTASDPGWSSADLYLGELKRGRVTDVGLRLIADLVADARMVEFRGIFSAVRAMGEQARTLREPLVRRLGQAGDLPAGKDPRKALSNVLDMLPPGTFAVPSDAERHILRDPALRRQAAGLIRRQADRGATSVPLLLEIVEHHTRAWAEKLADRTRRNESDDLDAVAVDSARVAFCRLGTAAETALPRLMALYRSKALPRLATGEREWTLTLARLGEPVSSFEKPDNMAGSTTRYQDNLRHRLERFDAERDCRSNFG